MPLVILMKTNNILILISIIMLSVTEANATATFTVSPNSQNVNIGSTFDVDVLLDSAASGVVFYHFELWYDFTEITANTIVSNELLGIDYLIEPGSGKNNTIGRVRYGEAPVGDPVAPVSGSTITIHFTAGSTPGTYPLNLKGLIFTDETETDLGTVAVNGTVTILPAATPTPTPTPTPTTGTCSENEWQLLYSIVLFLILVLLLFIIGILRSEYNLMTAIILVAIILVIMASLLPLIIDSIDVLC